MPESNHLIGIPCDDCGADAPVHVYGPMTERKPIKLCVCCYKERGKEFDEGRAMRPIGFHLSKKSKEVPV